MNNVTLLFASYLAPSMYKTYLYVTEYVERSIDVPCFLLAGEDLEDFASGNIDVGFIEMSSYTYLARQQPCAIERIAVPVFQGAAHYVERNVISEIVVRRESSFLLAEDLHECVVSYCVKAYPEKSCAPVYRSLDETLLACSTCPLSFTIKDALESSSHVQTLSYVLDGRADAAIIEPGLLNIVLRNSPVMAEQLRILGSFTVSRTPAVVVATRLDPQLKRKIQEALLKMHHEEFFAQRLREGSIERFVAVEADAMEMCDEIEQFEENFVGV